MALKDDLKTLFVTGYKITQANYASWIDGLWFKSEEVSAASADLATFATSAGSADLATFATSADFAVYTDYASSAAFADLSTFATSAAAADLASSAIFADLSTFAASAGSATFANSSASADLATVAASATYVAYVASAASATYAEIANMAVNAAPTASPQFSGDAKFDMIVLPKNPGKGIKVDTLDPTYVWRDLEGVELVDTAGANAATLAIYRGPVREFAYSAGDIMDIRFHIPHDYVPNTDMYIHIHWSHNGTGISGNFVGNFNYTFAKGHNQQTFPAVKNVNVTYDTVSISATPQYMHRVDEVIFTTPISGGTAALLDTATIEPDGLILVNFVMTTIPNITGGTPDPFIHRIDIHYQSTNIGTKQKESNFYV